MKLNKTLLLTAIGIFPLTACTNLDEEVFDQIMADNYYNTQQNVISSVFRPFEHAFWSIGSRQASNELSADQLITPTRDGWWDDGGKWRRMHYHSWTIEDDTYNEWLACYQGISQCNMVIEDMQKLSAEQFNFTEEEFNSLAAQDRVLRCWFYIRLLDAFRNVPLTVSFYDMSLNSVGQVEPSVMFKFIESELTESIELLSDKKSLGGNGESQGRWNKASAAALLVRLYLNAEKYIGEDRYDECASYAKKILDGEYGPYKIGERWDEAFDWDNDLSDEILFGFPTHGKGYSYWHYESDTYKWTTPDQAQAYLNDNKCPTGDHNPKYACTPSFAPDGTRYSYELGGTVEKFRNYPEDARLKLYRNLGNGRREGMMLFGKLPRNPEYSTTDFNMEYVRDPNNQYDLCIRDAVGRFHDLPEGEWLQSESSTLNDGDHNSGYHFLKYPEYPDTEQIYQLEADYAEIRLPEIIYSLAECKWRRGEKNEAAKLLNSVRKRNYPEEKWNDYLYAPDGNTQLSEEELLDEWGREFFAEGRRRIDLIRFNKFCQGAWFDKTPDNDNHTEIYPIQRRYLNANPALVQNPGY